MSTIIVTGTSGFVGRAFVSAPRLQADCVALPVARNDAAPTVRRVAREHPDRPLRVLNLAWPAMHAYASTRRSAASQTSEWDRYKAWVADLATETARVPGARFFGIGSGIEPYALGERPALGEPYVTYARHKSELRDILRGTPALEVVWLRLHFMFGPHEDPARLVPRLLRACLDGVPVEVGALERRRHWLHVDDAARGLAQALASDSPQDWDITGPHAVSFQDLIGSVEAVVGRPLALGPPGRPVADEHCPYIAPTNLPSFMCDPLRPPASLADGLKRYMIWITQHSG